MRAAWNHNLHYHGVVLAALPSPCRRALDVGCGDGVLSRALALHCAQVTAIDLDEAAQRATAPNLEYLTGDFMQHAFEPASFECIAMAATLHHLPLEPALARCRELLAPGGVLAVIGLYRPTIRETLLAPVALTASWMLRQLRGFTPVTAATAEPRETLAEIRRAAQRILPGAMIRRRLLFRYTLIWRKPARPSLTSPR